MSTPFNTQAQQLVRCGFHLFEIEGKRPLINGWNKPDANLITHPEDPRLRHNEFGWPVQPGYCVVDVDHPEHFDFGLMAGHASQVSASGGRHYLCQASGELEKKHPWGDLLRPGHEYAKVVGGQCSQSEEWQRWEVEPLPRELGNGSTTQQTSSRDEGHTLRVSQPYTIDDPGQGNRNDQLTALAGFLAEHGPEAFLAVQGQKWGLSALEIERTVLRSFKKWRRQEAREPVGPVVIPTTDLAQMDLPELEWWTPGLGKGAATLLYGPTGHGKSFFAKHLIQKAEVKTLLVDTEMSLPTLKKRWGKGMATVDISQAVNNGFMDWDYTNWDLVVLDTKSGAYSSKYAENEADHWASLAAWVKELVSLNKGVMVIHHAGKDRTKGARGSSAAGQIFDLTIGIEKTECGTRYVVKTDKNRHDCNVPDGRYEIRGREFVIVFD